MIELCNEIIVNNVIFNLKKFMNYHLSPSNKSTHSNSVNILKTNNLFSKNSPLPNINLISSGNKNSVQKKTPNHLSYKKLDFNSDLNINLNNIIIIQNQDSLLNENEFENMTKSKTLNYNNKNNSNIKDNTNQNNKNKEFKSENIQKNRINQNFTKSRNNFIKIQESISLTTLEKINKLRKGRIDQTNSIHSVNNNLNCVNNKKISNNLNNNSPKNSALANSQNQQGIHTTNNIIEKSNFQKYMNIVSIIFSNFYI